MVYKGNDKDPLSLDKGYRGISLLNILSKLFDILVYERIKVWSEHKSIPNELQGAGRKNVSCLHTSFIMQEIVAFAKESNQKVYCAFLDTKKAFDTIWTDALLVKLWDIGIRGTTWAIMKQSYQGRKANVRLNGVLSREFTMEQGLRQGGVLSMFHYTIFIDELIHKLQESNLGISMGGNVMVSSPTVADDMVLLALWKINLDKMLDFCNEYSEKWGTEYGPSKSAVMVYGESKQERTLQREKRIFMIGECKIDEVNNYTHLGVEINIDGNNDKRTKEQIRKAKVELNTMSSLGIRPGCLAPTVASGLYWKVCIPTMLYGSEVWFRKSSDTEQLEIAHRAAAKRIQWLPANTPNEAVLALLGWINVDASIDKKQLMFMGSMVRLPETSIPKQVFMYRYKNSPTCGLVKQYCGLLDKYGLKHEFEKWLVDQEHLNHNKWKSIVKKKVKDYQFCNWRIRMYGSKRLHMFKEVVTKLKPNLWWVLVRECYTMRTIVRSVISLVCGVFALRAYNENCLDRDCMKCNMGRIESIKHVIIECPYYTDVRKKYVATLELYCIEFGDDEKNIKKILGCEDDWSMYTWSYAKTGLELCAKLIHEIVQNRFEIQYF